MVNLHSFTLAHRLQSTILAIAYIKNKNKGKFGQDILKSYTTSNKQRRYILKIVEQ